MLSFQFSYLDNWMVIVGPLNIFNNGSSKLNIRIQYNNGNGMVYNRCRERDDSGSACRRSQRLLRSGTDSTLECLWGSKRRYNWIAREFSGKQTNTGCYTARPECGAQNNRADVNDKLKRKTNAVQPAGTGHARAKGIKSRLIRCILGFIHRVEGNENINRLQMY